MSTTRKLAVLGAAALSAPTAAAEAAVPLRVPLAGAPSVRSQMRDHQHDRLLRSHARLARKAEEKEAAGVRLWSNGELRRDNARLRRALRRDAASQAGGGAGGVLATIRQCESGGNYATDTGNGFYGAYQFTQSSWQAVGGTGNPAAASPAEQDKRAAMLMARSGAGNWPVCGA